MHMVLEPTLEAVYTVQRSIATVSELTDLRY